MALYTIDPYASIEQYNDSLQALRNNKVPFRQMISLRAPFMWYFELPYAPLLVNYDTLDAKQLRYTVSKVVPITPSDDYTLIRRETNGIDGLIKYIENTPLMEARKSKFALFFNAPNMEGLKNASKAMPGTKIYYFGKHVNSKYRIALCTNIMINNFITPNSVLLEKNNLSKGARKTGGSEGTQGNQSNDYSKPGFFEADLNFRVFKNKDALRKYSETPYFLDGVYYPVKFQGTLDNPDIKARFTF